MNKKYLLTCFLIPACAQLLSACGKSDVPEGYFTLNEITEGDETVKEKDLDDYGLEGSYLVFDEDGEGYIMLLDTASDISFNKKDQTVETKYGEVAFKKDGKNVILSDGQVSMTFKKSKKDAPQKPDKADFGKKKPQADADDGTDDIDWDAVMGVEGDALGTFWNDKWFGWWELDGNINEWDQYEDIKFPVLATTSLDSDGTGNIYLWDNDGMLADVTCSNNGYGLTEYGTMLSESGEFFGEPIEHADWNIDPGIYDDHKGYIRIDAYYRDKDGNNLFSYTIHLVKWGLPWDDFDEDELPDNYEWYMDQINSGNQQPETMPE